MRTILLNHRPVQTAGWGDRLKQQSVASSLEGRKETVLTVDDLITKLEQWRGCVVCVQDHNGKPAPIKSTAQAVKMELRYYVAEYVSTPYATKETNCRGAVAVSEEFDAVLINWW